MPAAPSRRALIKAVAEQLGVLGPDEQTDDGKAGAYGFAKALELGPNGYTKARRWYEGGPISYEDAWKMLDLLGWVSIEPRPIEVAEDLVKRLDAGEHVPRRELEQAARAVERVAADLPRLAARLREGARAVPRAK